MTTDRDDDVLEQNLTTLLAGAGPEAPSPEARARMRARLLARHGHDRPRRSPVAIAGWGLVAAAAGAMVIANVVGGGGGGGDGRTISAPTTPGAKADAIVLADGSKAELGAGGSLTELGPRRVRVEGAVLLDVAPGQGTFQVETRGGQLSVLGTRFLVEALADRTTTSVLRGVVALRSGGAEEVLHAGEQGVMQQGVRPTRGPAPRLSHLVSWVAERRRKDERPDAGPMRSGALVARNPAWQDQEFPLPMSAFTLDVHLENQVARVALDQTFHNPQDQTLEGVYKFALPPGAAVSRLAMYVDGKLMESAVVERMAARRIYEDIVYQRRDPALLEQMGASKVSMRIFPLPPHQDKRVVLAYTQPLARTYDDLTLTVPLPELDQPVGEVAMQVNVIGCAACEITSPSHAVDVRAVGADAAVSYRATKATLGDSLVLRVRQPAPAVAVATTIADAQRYVLVRARPTMPTAAVAARPSRWIILDDTSASRGPTELRAQAALVDHLIDDIDEHDQVMVIAFDATHRRFGPWRDAMAIDRRALAEFLGRDAGLGETDLAEALAGAVTLLDGQPGYVVYVGDGTATGERRTIDELRDAIAGKATFIGLGVGDGADLTTLSALADATGGLASAIDLGDDLAWRSLDLVASLYTTRVTGLTATLDGPGPDAVALLRSHQVAAGEDIELVVRAPARDDVRAVTLRGDAGGQPWSQTITLASAARAPGDGGYLPRLWAQRRLEALVTAGDRALAPCASTPCPTDEERAIAAYHARKREMVALGTEHFLLSQHTSLIVLENDAMYAQYGVRKGTGATWAPYALPATIAATAVAPVPVATAPVWRLPLAWRYEDGGGAAFGLDALAGGLAGEESFGTIGLGVRGTIGHGSGTGSGYGFGGTGFGRGGGGKAAATAAGTEEAKVGKKDRADAPMPVEHAAMDDGDRESAGAALEDPQDNRTKSSGDYKPTDVVAALDVTEADKAGDRAGADTGAVTTATPTMPSGSASAAQPPAPPPARAEAEPASGPPVARTRSVGRASDRTTAISQPLAQRQQATWRYYNDGRLMPIALASSGDWRIDDLTLWLPGLARTPYDDAAEVLEQRAGGAAGTVAPDAAEVLTRARAALAPGRWQWGSDPEVTIDGRGRLGVHRTLDTGVEETQVYDGSTLAFRYPQFGVGVDRLVGDHEPALLATLTPLVPPRPAQLARFYRVTKLGDRQLALAPVAGGATVRMTLTADGVIGELAEVDGAEVRVLQTARRSADGWAVTTGGRTLVARYHADPAATVDDAGPATVAVELPLAPLALARQQAAAATAGSDAWRHLQHQRAATALALGIPAELAAIAGELVSAGALAPAELALVSGGARWIDAATLRRALGTQTGAVVDHLRLVSAGRDALAKLATTDGPVGLIAAHRLVLTAVDRGDRKAALAAFRALADRGRGEVLRTIAGIRMATAFAWDDPAVVSALDTIAVGPYRNQIRQEAAYLASYRGRTGTAAERWIALMTDVDLAAAPPTIDYQAYSMVVGSARGQLGWTQALTAWRQRVLTSDRLDHVLAFVRAAAMTPGDDLDAGLDRALALAGDDVDTVGGLYALAVNAGRAAKAQAILDGALARRPGHPALLRLASATAEQVGDPGKAAALLDRAMTGEADQPVALAQLQADYTRLIALHGQLARAATGASRDAEVAAALAAGRDWRAMDPDNAQRERALAELLLAVGQDDEAWRYLSSPIDRAPREGTSFQGAAEVLERAGKLDQARGLWRRAFAIDATNPTWLQRQAMTELAQGDKAAARVTVQKILDRTWHVRWDGVRWWAQDARRSL
ncbi:MAG: FecR domain-containing protein [Myxococcales bacterium]|nr:FecR domain-containing protein [Myxococcales bacterium]